MIGEANTGWQDLDREVVAEMLERVGENWLSTANMQIKDAEERTLVMQGNIYPGKSESIKAAVSGITEHLYRIYGDDDDRVYLEAMSIFTYAPEESHSWAFFAELASEFADLDKIDRAKFMCVEDGPIQEEYKPYVHLAIAEGYARKGDNENTLDNLFLAFLASRGQMYTHHQQELDDVFKAKLDRELNSPK
jgi:hypothetical protein